MKRSVVWVLFWVLAAFPFALAAESAPQEGEITEVVSGSLYRFTIGRLDKSTLESKNVFADNLTYFLEHHQNLRIRDLTPILGAAESRCVVAGLPVPGRTVGYWVWTREALPRESVQRVKFYAYTPNLVDRALSALKIFPDLAGRIVIAPLNTGDYGSLSGYYVLITGEQPENFAAAYPRLFYPLLSFRSGITVYHRNEVACFAT